MTPISAGDLAYDIAARIDALGPVTVSRFFAGAALIADGVQFGFVMKGLLYLPVDDKSGPAFKALGAAPYAHASRSKALTVTSYYKAQCEVVDDPDQLDSWTTEALCAALAARRRRSVRSRRLSSGVAP